MPKNFGEGAVGQHGAEDGDERRPGAQALGRPTDQDRRARQGQYAPDEPARQGADGVGREATERRAVAPGVGGQRDHAPVGDLAERGVAGRKERPDRGDERRQGDFDDDSPWLCSHLALILSLERTRMPRWTRAPETGT